MSEPNVNNTGNWLVKVGDGLQAAGKIVKSVYPFLVAQFEKTSDAYIKQKANLASIETMNELIAEETKMFLEVKKELFSKLAESGAIEKMRIKRDIEYVDSCSRLSKIVEKSLLYLPLSQKTEESTPTTEEISPHWMDKFKELARVKNEPWREELLARALATQAASPGSLTMRALWLIGTLEKESYQAFSSFLDVCSKIDNAFILPSKQEDALSRVIPDCPLGDDVDIGRLLFMLGDTGLVADFLSSYTDFPKGTVLEAAYFSNKYQIACEESLLRIQGVLPTGIGSSIANLYEQQYNKLGEEIFEEWLKTLDNEKYQIVNLTQKNNGPKIQTT